MEKSIKKAFLLPALVAALGMILAGQWATGFNLLATTNLFRRLFGFSSECSHQSHRQHPEIFRLSQ
jgi:hypothetical protein